MFSKKHILSPLAILLFFNSSLIAVEEAAQESVEAPMDGHVSVRSRELDPAKRERMQSLRAKQNEDEETTDQTDAQQNIRKANNEMTFSTGQFMLAPQHIVSPQLMLASYAFPINSHWLTSIADNSRTIELEDGSHWEVAPSDYWTLNNWGLNDALVITPNYNFFSSYDYYITNKRTNSFVSANMYVGPLAFGPFSHWIVDVDYFGGHVYLENQMVWCVNPQDSYLLKDWAVNDHIIFGLYNSWFSPFDHILINVNMDNHIRARQY
jgi:hypothetical protein